MKSIELPSKHDHDGILIIDSGADTSGIGGTEWIIDEVTERSVNVSGYDNQIHSKNSKIGSAITAVDLPDETTVLIKINEATLLGEKGNSLLSTIQAEHYGTEINNIPKFRGGTIPYIKKDNTIIPLTIKNGLLAIKIRKPTKEELEECETVILTSNQPWDPEEINEDFTAQDFQSLSVDIRENYNFQTTRKIPQNIHKLNEHLLNPGILATNKTLQATTKLATQSKRVPLRAHLKTRNPVLSCTKLMEPWATDTVFFDVTSYEGYNCAQVFVGTKSMRILAYGMKQESDGPDALLDMFWNIGVPLSMRRDNSKMQASHVWNSIMRDYHVKDEYTEPHHPQQNPAERRHGVIKDKMKRIFSETKCNPRAWFRLYCHVCDIMNHTAYKSINWRTPIEESTGETPNISGLLDYFFWDTIIYYDPPSEGEKKGRWLGRAQNYGDTLCHWILTENTEQLIVCGTVCTLTDKEQKFIEELKETGTFPLIETLDEEFSQKPFSIPKLPITFSPEKLLDKIIYYGDHKGIVKERINDTQYRVSYDNDKKQGIMDYDEIIRQLTQLDDDEDCWTIEEILNHKWDPTKKGKILVLIKWERLDEPTWEPMEIIKEDDPVTLAEYARDHDLLNSSRWKWAKRYLMLKKRSLNYLRQLHAKKNNKGPKYQFGEQVPKSIKEALAIDQKFKHTG